jgi:hypothetical protein
MPFFEIYFSHAIRGLVGKGLVWGLDKVFHRRRDGLRESGLGQAHESPVLTLSHYLQHPSSLPGDPRLAPGFPLSSTT